MDAVPRSEGRRRNHGKVRKVKKTDHVIHIKDTDAVVAACGVSTEGSKVRKKDKTNGCVACMKAVVEDFNATADEYNIMADRLREIQSLSTPPDGWHGQE